MKKLMLVLAVALLAAPAMATVAIQAVDNADCSASINYSSTGTLPRAFGLNITVDGGAVITGVDVTGAQPFNIYLGTIVIAADGTVTDAGTPVAPATDPGALGGIGTSGITVEMGSLYDKTVSPNAAKPAASGLLIKVTVDKACNIGIQSNSTRAGVVLEDATQVAPILQGAAITCAATICKGDLNNDGGVDTTDLSILINRLIAHEADEYWYECPGCAEDMNNDGGADTTDLSILINNLIAHEADEYWYPCP